MIRQRPIELLAPAKNLECGIEAINHGADAVYIGAPRFGVRAAAGNSAGILLHWCSMRMCRYALSLRYSKYDPA